MHNYGSWITIKFFNQFFNMRNTFQSFFTFIFTINFSFPLIKTQLPINKNLMMSDYDFDYNFIKPFDDDNSEQETHESPRVSEDEEYPYQSHRTSPTWNYFEEQTTQHPGHPVCCKCQQVFGKDTGISTLKRHLLNAHKIKINNIKNVGKIQSTLKFRRTDPWPEKEK